jgi:hypothetical protein
LRFVHGEYAWAMQEGLMIAYARTGRTISKDLAPVLAGSRHKDLGSPSAPVVVICSGAPSTVEALQSTLHQRGFNWPGNSGKACEIRVFHSWHNCA